MKISLTAAKDIQIIQITETVNVKDIQVLKIGITTLFKNGKNKFLINFSDAQDLPGPVLHELALFEVLARELSGKIVLVSPVAAVQGKIKDFMKPPLLEVFASLELGLRAFLPKPEVKKAAPVLAPVAAATAATGAQAAPAAAATKAVAPAAQAKPVPLSETAKPAAPGKPLNPIVGKPLNPSVGKPAPAAEETPKPPEMFKEQIKHREITELGPLRRQIELLEAENRLLKTKILVQMFDNRKPQDTAAAQARILTLEDENKKLLELGPPK